MIGKASIVKNVAVVLSAGSGSRMKSDIKKQYMEICGKPLIYYSLEAFEKSIIDEVILVVSEGDEDFARKEIVEHYGFKKVTAIVTGGKERYHSVRNGLLAAPSDTDYSFIHDGARPFVTDAIIERALDAVKQYGACVVGMPAKDTIKISDDDGFAAATPDRKHLWTIQTPQVFFHKLILDSYNRLADEEESLIAEGINITDDAMVVEYFTDTKVKLVEGSYENIKITTPEDITLAEAIITHYAEK